jgi:hypothetical protein
VLQFSIERLRLDANELELSHRSYGSGAIEPPSVEVAPLCAGGRAVAQGRYMSPPLIVPMIMTSGCGSTLPAWASVLLWALLTGTMIFVCVIACKLWRER